VHRVPSPQAGQGPVQVRLGTKHLGPVAPGQITPALPTSRRRSTVGRAGWRSQGEPLWRLFEPRRKQAAMDKAARLKDFQKWPSSAMTTMLPGFD